VCRESGAPPTSLLHGQVAPPAVRARIGRWCAGVRGVHQPFGCAREGVHDLDHQSVGLPGAEVEMVVPRRTGYVVGHQAQVGGVGAVVIALRSAGDGRLDQKTPTSTSDQRSASPRAVDPLTITASTRWCSAYRAERVSPQPGATLWLSMVPRHRRSPRQSITRFRHRPTTEAGAPHHFGHARRSFRRAWLRDCSSLRRG
jgi:hypothetical protein